MHPTLIPWPEPTVLTAIIAAGAVALGGWLTWLASGASRLQARVDRLEDRQDQLWADRERDDLTKRAMGDHIDVLEAHIWDHKPPPPPTRPAGV